MLQEFNLKSSALGMVPLTPFHGWQWIMGRLMDDGVMGDKRWLTGAFYVGLLDGLLGVAGMIITSDYGSFPKIPCV